MAGRAFQFNLRSAVLRATGDTPRSLVEGSRAFAAVDPADLYAVAPPDFVNRLGFTGEWLAHDSRGTRRALLGTRLAFQAHRGACRSSRAAGQRRSS